MLINSILAYCRKIRRLFFILLLSFQINLKLDQTVIKLYMLCIYTNSYGWFVLNSIKQKLKIWLKIPKI